jgi:hypothetical protein
MPNTERDAPIRPKLLSDNELPKIETSTSDSAAPIRAIPNKDTEEPSREKLLKEIELPIWR